VRLWLSLSFTHPINEQPKGRRHDHAPQLPPHYHGSLVLGGAIVGTAMWPKQHAVAAPENPTIHITALMSTVDVASLPMTEVADLF
jgi:hypothetical protein